MSFVSLVATAAPAGAAAAADELAVNSIWDFVVKGGVMMIPIGVCSFIVVAVVAERSLVLRMARVVPKKLAAGVEALAERAAKNPSDAASSLEKDGSPLGRILRSGASQAGRSIEHVESRMAAAGEHEVFSLRARLRVLSVIAAVTPLLGLVGTIFGMIKAFQTVAISGEALGKAELLATGIYEAMITTAAGLLVAIPTLICYHWISGKVDRMVRELDRASVRFCEALSDAKHERRHGHSDSNGEVVHDDGRPRVEELDAPSIGAGSGAS